MPDEEYWHALMRQALGVPDHVSEAQRVRAVAWALLQRGSASRVTEDEAVKVVDLIARMGAAGDLDGWFVSFSHGDSDTTAIMTMAEERAGIPNRAFVRSSLGLVVKFAKAHPYRGETGRLGPATAPGGPPYNPPPG